METAENRVGENIFLTVRPGYEKALLLEIGSRQNVGLVSLKTSSGNGWVGVSDLPLDLPKPLRSLFVFERQRLPKALWFPFPPETKSGSGRGQSFPVTQVAEAVLGKLTGHSGAWWLHAFTPDPQSSPGFLARAEAMGRDLQAEILRAQPALANTLRGEDTPPPTAFVSHGSKHGMDATTGRVVQFCLLEAGVWVSVAAPIELSSSAPGGILRMPGDADAPSRSYLKLEEAFHVLGRQPQARQRVIDLGAAPGGWSYGCLKRGCHVLAVDNGPMKIRILGDLPGRLEHQRTNGLTFRPAQGWLPTDWLVSDMLVPPGETMGLLRRWLDNGWMQRFVVNVKLPQKNPVQALLPLLEYLEKVPGLRFRMTQLYHDRREVTVVGELASPPRPVDVAVSKQAHQRPSAQKTSPKRGAKPGGKTGGKSGEKSSGKPVARSGARPDRKRTEQKTSPKPPARVTSKSRRKR